MSGVQAGVSILELIGNSGQPRAQQAGHRQRALENMGGLSPGDSPDRELKPLKQGVSGWVTRAGGVLSGPLPLAMRLIAGNSGSSRSRRLRRWRRYQASPAQCLTRYGWMQAGHASARDWRLPLEVESGKESEVESSKESAA